MKKKLRLKKYEPYKGEFQKIEELIKKVDEEKKLLIEAREYEQLRTEFFANLSHELRTPLNIILASQQLVSLYVNNAEEIQNNSDKISSNLKIMRQNCNRLMRLINNLLDITKIDSGFYELHLKNRNIVNIVEEITLSVAEYIKSMGITLIFDTDIEEKVVACDPDKIERIILNLLSNSVKFMKSGGEISVNVYDRKDYIQVSVKDNGIGIPEDKLNLIFDRFSQVDKSFTRKSEGSGIGLSLVKSLVELHGGTISVRSQYGKGTEFTIQMPTKSLPEKSFQRINNLSNCASEGRIERMEVEFSDIYSF